MPGGGDPNYAHWRMGEVIAGPAQLMQALERAVEQFDHNRAVQQAMADAAFGPDDGRAPWRVAEAIERFLDPAALLGGAPASRPDAPRDSPAGEGLEVETRCKT